MESTTHKNKLSRSCWRCQIRQKGGWIGTRKRLGARLLWSLGSVVGLENWTAHRFFLHEPVKERFRQSEGDWGRRQRESGVGVVDQPDEVIDNAAVNGGGRPGSANIKNHVRTMGHAPTRGRGCTDPFRTQLADRGQVSVEPVSPG